MRPLCVLGLAAACLAAASLIAGPASARPVVKTKYTYYAISGNSARDLYREMISRGPHVSGDRALAATSAETRQSGEFVKARTCRVNNYRIGIDFTIKLPQVRNERGLSKRVRRDWKKFYAFVRAHEERHRAIWIGCAREVERKVLALRAPDCREADRAANQIFRAVAAACEKKHDAFDRAEQKRLARHPLVVAAQRVPRNTRTIAATARTQQGANARRYVGARATNDFR